ncbi:MAG: AAA family ATPase, partial [Solirubrobacteraceae bacterium]
MQNLLLIEEARLELTGGLNVLTGETGAGKTVLAHALDLLLGGRGQTGAVRPGAPKTSAEGVFELER